MQPVVRLGSVVREQRVYHLDAADDRIVAEVERRLSVIDQHEKAIRANLARAARLRQSILKRAFSGRLVPQDPTDEPASMLLERIHAQRKRIIRNS